MRAGRYALLAVFVVVVAVTALAWARARRPPSAAPTEISPVTARSPDPPPPADPSLAIARRALPHPVAVTRPAPASEEAAAALRIDTLVSAGDIGRARDAAEDFLRRYPYSGYCQHIETLTGVHPRPSMPGE